MIFNKFKSILIVLLILNPFNTLFLIFIPNNDDFNEKNSKSLDNSNLDIATNKIDPRIFQILNNNDKEGMKVSVIISYNYNDEDFKDRLEKNSDSFGYNYKLIPATSIYSSKKEIFTIAKSPIVKRIFLDKKVYPLSIEKKSLAHEYYDAISPTHQFNPLVNQSVNQIGAPHLWDLNYNGSGTVVAVLDTGIDKTHPDLNDLDDNFITNDPKIVNEVSFIDYNFDGIIDEDANDIVGHGTHVAGIISGTGEASNNRYKGVAPASNLLNVKVLSTYGGYDSWIIKGIEYAALGADKLENTGDEADIISMSLGGSGYVDDLIVMAVNAAWDLNKTVVIAAGNSGDDFFTIESPGLSSKAITVSATDQFDQIAKFSSRGPSPDLSMGIDICAPGVNIISTRANLSELSAIDGNYTSKSGTSMATPFVAGVVALLLHSDPDLTPTTIKTALMISAIDLGVSSYIQGAGRVDVYAAYNLINEQLGIFGTELKRANLMNQIEFDTFGIRGEFESPFYSNDLGDWHRNGTYGRPYSDLYQTLFAVRYKVSQSQKFYLSDDLIRIYPRELRWLVYNSTHKIAVDSLLTPDENLKINILFEIYDNSKWIRISFNITSLSSMNIENLKFYYYMDPDVYSLYSMDDELDASDDGEFIQSINALVANDTYYDETTHPKFGFHPNNYFGLSSFNNSIAYEVNDYYDAYYNMVDDTLSNSTYYHGDVALVQQWLNTTLSPNKHTLLPLIIAFGDNRTNFIDNVNEAKNAPFFKLKKSDIAINTLSIINPIYNATLTYLNVSITNVGYSSSSQFKVTTFIDHVEINETEITGLSPDEEIIISIPVIINGTGIHNITIIANYSQGEFEMATDNNKLERNVRVITSALVTLFPQSPFDNPLNLKYAGQFLFWNCSILQGERFSELKLNKTGSGKGFVSFNGNPSSTDEIAINPGIGQYFVNISVNIPKGLTGNYQFKLQLLNSSDMIYEITVEYELLGDIPLNLFINQSSIEEAVPEDGDGIVEGDEYGKIEFLVQSNDTTTTVTDVFLIITAKNHSSINIMDYNVGIKFYIGPNASEWSYDDLDFTVPYNISNTNFAIWSVIFARVGYTDDYIPFYQGMLNYSIHQRTPGTPDLELNSVTFYDLLLYSDDDLILEPGETGYVEIIFRNIGDGSALQIFNTNISCSDSRVTIHKPFFIFVIFAFPTTHIQWNGIDPGDISRISSSLPFFTLSDSIRRGEILHFKIDIEYCNMDGDKFEETFQFSYRVPSMVIVGDDDDEDEDDDAGVISIGNYYLIFLVIGIISIMIVVRKKALTKDI